MKNIHMNISNGKNSEENNHIVFNSGADENLCIHTINVCKNYHL